MTWSGALVGGDVVVGFDRRSFVGARQLGGFAQPRQRAIASGAVGSELGEGGLCLLMLAGFGKRHRGFEGGAGFGRFLGLPPVIAAPAADRDDDQNAARNGEVAVALPQLLQLFAPDFFIDFLEYVGHGPVPNTRQKTRPKDLPQKPAQSPGKRRRN